MTILGAAGFTGSVVPARLGAWRKDVVKQQSLLGGAYPQGTSVIVTMEETFAPLVLGAAGLAAATAVLGWVMTWPLRISVRGTMDGAILPSGREMEPATGPEVRAAWNIDVADFQAEEGPGSGAAEIKERFDA
jgi:hypothetical protein